MKRSIVATLAIAAWSSFLLAGCDSSDSSSSTGSDPAPAPAQQPGTTTPGGTTIPGGTTNPGGTTTPDDDINASLSVAGMSTNSPAEAASVFADSLTLTISTNLDSDIDTGWTLIINSAKGNGNHPIVNLSGVNNLPGEDGEACMYKLKSGSLTISNWTETTEGSVKLVSFGGSGSMQVTAMFAGQATTCPDRSISFTFRDVDGVDMRSVTGGN